MFSCGYYNSWAFLGIHKGIYIYSFFKNYNRSRFPLGFVNYCFGNKKLISFSELPD